MKAKNQQLTLNRAVYFAAALALFQFGASYASQAQENSAAVAQNEVAITPNKPIRQLRRELDTAEKEFFAVFNKINSDNDFDTKCKRVSQLGSRKKEQVCTPKFLRIHQASSTSSSLVTDRWDVPSSAGSRMQMKKTQMREEINRLLADNENFMRVFQSFSAAKRAYEAGMQSQ